jgi:hypothetical protein
MGNQGGTAERPFVPDRRRGFALAWHRLNACLRRRDMAGKKASQPLARRVETLLEALHNLINPQSRQSVPVRSDDPDRRLRR